MPITNNLVTTLVSLFLNPAIIVMIFSIMAIIFEFLRREKFFQIIVSVSIILLFVNLMGQAGTLDLKFANYQLQIRPLGLEERMLSFCFLLCFFCQLLFYRDAGKLSLLVPISGLLCSIAMLILQVDQMIVSVVLLELAAIASTILIFSEVSQRSFKLGLRYLIIHILSASVLIAGLAIDYSSHGVMNNLIMLSDFSNLGVFDLNKIVQGLILFALLIDCGTFPFSNWMVESYSVSHPYIAVTISTFISKIIIVLIAKLFMGSDLLIYIGSVSMFCSGFLALATGNLRQILTYSQIGKFGLLLILIGIGGSTMRPLIFYMLSYFMISGLILFLVVGKLKLDHGADALNEVLFDNKKTTLFSVIGILSAISFPLTGGYLAKLLMNNFLILNPKLYIIVSILLVPHFVAICKLFLPYFRHQDLISSDEDEWSKSQLISISILSLAIIISGFCFYKLFYFQQDFMQMFVNSHALIDFFIMFMIVLTFIYLARKVLIRKNVILLDLDWFIRIPGNSLFTMMFGLTSTLGNKILTLITGGDSILRSLCVRLMGRDRSLFFVIDGFVLTLFVLFVILFL